VKQIILIVVFGLIALLGVAGCERPEVAVSETNVAAEAMTSPAMIEESIDGVEEGAGAPIYPSFTLPDFNGIEHTLAEWDGRPRLLNFWATWCAPCRREIPLLKAVQDEQGADGVQIIGIAVDFPEEVAAYAETAQFNYPVLVGQDDAMAVAETSGVPFIGLPFTMIIAPDGEFLHSHVGEIHREDLDHIVDVFEQLGRGEIDKQAVRDSLDSL
jgi:thiol-disulfide isomerase/thioredoxin